MFDYAVCEISGRQYKVLPDQIIEVDSLGEIKTLICDKVLMLVEKGKIELGTPYLSKKVEFEVLGTIKKPKIRVATYKAKSNYHRVKGSRRQVSQIRLVKN